MSERALALTLEGVPAEAASVLLAALDALAHYRNRVHLPADEGWMEVRTWVNDECVALADSALARARAHGWLDRGRTW